ncbi:hypothetical protein Tco_0369547 [Tanacetum coccineum]
MAPKRTIRSTPAATTTTTTTVTNAHLKAMIDQGVTNALAAHDADKNMNGYMTHKIRNGKVDRMLTKLPREALTRFHKVPTFKFQGHKRSCALTWWNSHVRTVCHDVDYAMTFDIPEKEMN